MERLQKVLARAGIASRRAAEQIILAGRVRVDGRIVRELGTQVDSRKSRVEVDGTKIVAEKLVYLVLHKPRGVVCTLSDPEGRPTIKELIKDAGARLVPVGRLDFHTSGALICTNDGEFAQALAHPKREVPKVYVAKVKGTVDDDALPRFSESLEIDGRPTQPAHVKRLRYEGDKTWLEITLREGRNRQVRRLGEATGFPVMRLARISHAGVTSEDLRPGQWRELSVDELVDLKKVYGVPKKVRSPMLETVKGRGGSTSRFDKRTPRSEGRAIKPAGVVEVRGEHWSRETSRDQRLKRESITRPGAANRDARDEPRTARPPREELRTARGRSGGGQQREQHSAPARSPRDEQRSARARSPRDEQRGDRARSSRDEQRGDRARSPRDEQRSARARSPRDEQRSARARSPRDAQRGSGPQDAVATTRSTRARSAGPKRPGGRRG